MILSILGITTFGIRFSNSTKNKQPDLIQDIEPLGITGFGYDYLLLTPTQKIQDEYDKTIHFMVNLIQNETIPQFKGQNRLLQFINYGDTELVYVLNVDNKKYTILINQPHNEPGVVKKEYENLIKLKKRFPNHIVAPFYYAKDNETDKELYVTPYLYQSRCIGSYKNWGEWVPEPEYHFRTYPEKQRKIINSCMIALLIMFYDDEKKLGLSACKIGGGDFMLEKGYENDEITHKNILKRMKLISAREFIPISLDDYIERIRIEFAKKTYYNSKEDRDKSILINHKARVPMLSEDIETGIQLGLKLRDMKLDE